MMAPRASSVTGMIARAVPGVAALSAALLVLQAMTAEARYDDVVAVVPPRIVAAIAKKNGVTVENLKPAIAAVITAALAAAKVESFSIDISQAKYKELPDGSPYALIPTKTVIDAGDKGRFAESTFSLAIIDDGKWYVIRVNDVANLIIMRSVYPEFAGVELPSGSMEILKK